MNSRSIARLGMSAASLISTTFSFFAPAKAEKYPPRMTNLVDPSGVFYGVEQYQDSSGYANDFFVSQAIDNMHSEYNMTFNPSFIPSSYDAWIKSWPADSFGYNFVSLFRSGQLSSKELEAGLINLLDTAQTQLEESNKNGFMYAGIAVASLVVLISAGIGIALACRRQKKCQSQVAQEENADSSHEYSKGSEEAEIKIELK